MTHLRQNVGGAQVGAAAAPRSEARGYRGRRGRARQRMGTGLWGPQGPDP